MVRHLRKLNLGKMEHSDTVCATSPFNKTIQTQGPRRKKALRAEKKRSAPKKSVPRRKKAPRAEKKRIRAKKKRIRAEKKSSPFTFLG